jgi:hypothetical protein
VDVLKIAVPVVAEDVSVTAVVVERRAAAPVQEEAVAVVMAPSLAAVDSRRERYLETP